MECTLFCFTGSKDDGDDDDDHSLTCAGLAFCKTTHSENVFSNASRSCAFSVLGSTYLLSLLVLVNKTFLKRLSAVSYREK